MNINNETAIKLEQYDSLPIPLAETVINPEPATEPFQLELSSKPSDSPELFEDDDEQQAEADVAPAAMKQLMENATGAEHAMDAEAAAMKEDEKRTAHEAAEKKRKEEWDARQQAIKAAETEAIRLIATLSDDAIITASMKKVEDGTERLTRRNMKLCVMEWIQTKCLDDPAFARMTMHPKKSMLNCFHYINRKAKEYIEQEMKDNDDSPQNGIYGGDVPDELCYQWAEEYFRDPDAKEDQGKEEKYVPKPFIGSSGRKTTASKKDDKKPKVAKAVKKEVLSEKEENDLPGQISIFDALKEVPT